MISFNKAKTIFASGKVQVSELIVTMLSKAILIFSLFSFIPHFNFAQKNLSDNYRQKAENLYGKNNQQALMWYKGALQEAEKNKDYTRMANLSVDISSMYHLESNYPKALNYCLLGLRYRSNLETVPDSINFKLYSCTGTMYKNLSHIDSVSYYYDLANQLVVSNPNLENEIPEYVLQHFNSYARWLMELGDIYHSSVFFEKAKTLGQKHKLLDHIDVIKTNLASLYERMGEFDKAQQNFEDVINNQSPNTLTYCYALAGKGWVLCNSFKPEQGLRYVLLAKKKYDDLIRQKRILPSFNLDVIIEYNIAFAFMTQGNIGLAKAKANDIIYKFKNKEINKNERLSSTWLLLSEINSNQPSLALNNLQEAIKANSPKFNSNNLFTNAQENDFLNEKIAFKCVFLKAKILYQTYTQNKDLRFLNASLSSLKLARLHLDNLRIKLTSQEAKLFFGIETYGFYPLAVEIANEKFVSSKSIKDKDFVFEIIENSKASLLREKLYSDAVKKNEISQSLLRKEFQINAQIEILKRKPSENAIKLQSLEMEKYFLIKSYEIYYPEYFEQKFNSFAPSVLEIQRKLESNEAYVSYFNTDNQLYIVIISNNKFKLVSLPVNKSQFENALKDIRLKLSQNPHLKNYEGMRSSIYLYETLIEPIRDDLKGINKLGINRSSKISFLPFEVLESGESQEDYLFKHFACYYLSFSSELFDSSHPKGAVKTLGIAPFTDKQADYLPHSLSQVYAVSDDVFEGSKATKEFTLSQINNYRIVYFATHSIINDNPFIKFFPNTNSKLSVSEISNLKLDNLKLAVLSSCDANSGKYHQLEGSLSLARAFRIAGCPSVLTTIWESHDNSTAFLTMLFDKYLKEGYSKAEALQKARITFLESDLGKKYNHPYFWANLIIVGEEIQLFESKTKGIFLGLILPLVCIAIFLIYKRNAYFSNLFKLNS